MAYGFQISLEYWNELTVYPDAIIGTAASAASSPTNLQRVKCSFRNRRASSTVTAGYSDEITTASSRRPVWLAWTKNIVPSESMPPVRRPSARLRR